MGGESSLSRTTTDPFGVFGTGVPALAALLRFFFRGRGTSWEHSSGSGTGGGAGIGDITLVLQEVGIAGH